MTLSLFLALLFFAGAVLHCIQAPLFGFNKTTIPVFIWGLGLAVLGYFWMQEIVPQWVKWVSLIGPLVGGLGLSAQLKASTNPKWIDYGIIGIDIVTVGIMIYILFL